MFELHAIGHKVKFGYDITIRSYTPQLTSSNFAAVHFGLVRYGLKVVEYNIHSGQRWSSSNVGPENVHLDYNLHDDEHGLKN